MSAEDGGGDIANFTEADIKINGRDVLKLIIISEEFRLRFSNIIIKSRNNYIY